MKEHTWPKGTCAVVGDSMLNFIDEKRLSMNNRLVKVRNHPGATTEELKYHLVPVIKLKPDYVLLHVGTNKASFLTSKQIMDNILQLKCMIIKSLPDCCVIIS